MTLYFMRHAQTAGNASNIWVGRRDESITQKGLSDLQKMVGRLTKTEFDYIYTSPLKRALNTAEIVAQALRREPQIHIRVGLEERDFGCFEGQSKTDERRNRLDFTASVEPMQVMRDRLIPVFEEITALQGNILVVSHSAVFRCVIKILGYKSMPTKTSLGNGEWAEIVRPHNLSFTDSY